MLKYNMVVLAQLYIHVENTSSVTLVTLPHKFIGFASIYDCSVIILCGHFVWSFFYKGKHKSDNLRTLKSQHFALGYYDTLQAQSPLLANSSVEHCRTDDLMPNVPIYCLPPSRVDPEVQGLKVIIDCPQPGSFRATYRPPPISRWSKCSGNDTVMVLFGSGTSKVSKETQPELLDPSPKYTSSVTQLKFIETRQPDG